MTSYEPLGAVAPKELRDARLEAHWAAQVVGAAADACLERRDDDSQSNLGWDAKRRMLVTHDLGAGLQAALRIESLALEVSSPSHGTDAYPLEGRTLDDAMEWMESALSRHTVSSRSLSLRDYDMPSHPVRDSGAAFEAPESALAELARWYANASTAINAIAREDERASNVRCWPHHFDLATLITLDPDRDPEQARSIGVGLSPGDDSYDEPYFYVNPWPRPKDDDKDDLPKLEHGFRWHTQGFVGAILRGSDLVDSDPDEQKRRVHEGLRSAVASERTLLGDTSD